MFERVLTKKTIATESNKRIVVYRRTIDIKLDGSQKENWEKHKEYWAAIYPIRSQKRIEFKSLGVEITHYLKIPGKVDILTTDIIVFDNREFEILTIENIQEKGEFLFLTCKEKKKYEVLK